MFGGSAWVAQSVEMSDSWFQLRSWFQGRETEPHMRLQLEEGLLGILPLSASP